MIKQKQNNPPHREGWGKKEDKKMTELKESKVGDMTVEVEIRLASTRVHYPDYSFYEFLVRGKRGSLMLLPFFTKNEFEGYLIYHNKNSSGYSKQELQKIGLDAIVSGVPKNIHDLVLLPYKPIAKDNSEDEIENAIIELITKNISIDLSTKNLFL